MDISPADLFRAAHTMAASYRAADQALPEAERQLAELTYRDLFGLCLVRVRELAAAAPAEEAAHAARRAAPVPLATSCRPAVFARIGDVWGARIEGRRPYPGEVVAVRTPRGHLTRFEVVEVVSPRRTHSRHEGAHIARIRKPAALKH